MAKYWAIFKTQLLNNLQEIVYYATAVNPSMHSGSYPGKGY